MTTAPQPRCGVLLAGGAGTRFGGAAKGLIQLGTERVADGPLRALAAVCGDVVIAANDPAAASWFPARRVVRDRVAGLGALGALETALRAAGGRIVVVCAWDMPFVTAAILAQLAAVVEAGASCCVPMHIDGQLEPLCAAYAASCAPVASELLDYGERAAHALIDAVAGSHWSIATTLSPDDAARTFFNVNTPDDLRRAASWCLPLPDRTS